MSNQLENLHVELEIFLVNRGKNYGIFLSNKIY
jgi:hypothetical protein